MAKTYEVEIKSLLGSKENADKLKLGLNKMFKDVSLVSKGKQLNHYFNIPADLNSLKEGLKGLIPAEKMTEFNEIILHGKKISLRARDSDGKVLLVIKASVGDDSSSNGVKRLEFEVRVDKRLDELDTILIKTGATYQAKWSREREEYKTGDLHVCLDRNAGYGYLAEFEKMASDESLLEKARGEILEIMQKLGFEELPQARLERMFDFYNHNWKDYYGTERTFVIE